MVSVTRYCSKNWNYIRIAILFYVAFFVCTITWLANNRRQPLLWLSNDRHRTTIVNSPVANKKSQPVELLQILKTTQEPKSKVITDYIRRLQSDNKTFCGGDFVAYSKVLAKLSNVVIDPKFGKGRKGGENISQVFKQEEEIEYYKLDKGYFQIKCSDVVSYPFIAKSHLNKWLSALKTSNESPSYTRTSTTWTMAVMRYEYANLYHTMTDYYNAFLTTQIFDLNPGETDILWVDGHPIGALDSTWQVLFGKVTRAGEIQEPTKYSNFVWNIMGYDSPLNQHNSPFIPYTEEFREFFLSRHGVPTERNLQCDKLHVLFIWRRDYLAHPRNPSGHVSRKIKNEDELLLRAKELLPGHVIEGLQIDNLTMSRQLQIISETDVLIGMHGAGLSHTMFLPKHAGLIELYPTYWGSSNRHFRAMCQWRKLKYLTWANQDSKRELNDHYTLIDVDAVMKMLHEMHHKLCGSSADHH